MTAIGSPESSEKFHEREIAAPRMRKRYLRRSTCITGHGRPLTRITSPHNPDWSSSVNSSEPSLLNSASDDDQRHVVAPVRDRQRLLQRVEHVVLRDQPVIRVLGGVMDAVVVVPQRSRRLEVRVVVVLVLAGMGDVAGVAVELRQRRRAVQVHRRPRLVAERRVNSGNVLMCRTTAWRPWSTWIVGPGHRPS